MKNIEANHRVPIKSWCNPLEEGAMKQAINLTALPFVFRHVALMADCHEGFGMPIGGVVACMDAIVPNAVGVDIGCGMCAVRTDLRPENIEKETVRDICMSLRKAVPMGFDHHKKDQPWDGFQKAPDVPILHTELKNAGRQLGTLGGGNHFIEIQRGSDGYLWFMIHSGSRNFGYKIARFYHEKALAYCEKRKFTLPDRDLAYLPMDTKEAQEYKSAMDFALLFARANRNAIKEQCKEILERIAHCRFSNEIDIHHNYAAQEPHFGRTVIVHRKGATSARIGETGIIPGSMGTASYIVEGLGNPESFESCSHGAGRTMGRNEANRRLSLEDARAAMKGVIFDGWKRGKNKKLDLSEAPQAYKDIESVMEAQKDLVEIKVKLTPLGVVKG
jgi:tRNA-splicing ligase RtcB (3'-phosphate/5'-hydroxy nucleic acid ligase)